MTLITQDVDLFTGKVTNIPQDYYFLASLYAEYRTLMFDLKVKKTTYIIDTGIIFSNEKKIEIVRSINLISSENFMADEGVTKNSISIPLIATIVYSLDR